MAMVPTSFVLPLLSPQGSEAISHLGHVGPMQRFSLAPSLDWLSRLFRLSQTQPDFIFPNFPPDQSVPSPRPVSLGFDSRSISAAMGDRSPPALSNPLTPEQQA